MATRISCITGRRGLDDLAGNSGSVDVAVSLQGMVGAVMTIKQATRKSYRGRSKRAKAGPAPRVLDKRERAVMKRRKWNHSWLLLVLLVQLVSYIFLIRRGYQNGYMNYSLTK